MSDRNAWRTVFTLITLVVVGLPQVVAASKPHVPTAQQRDCKLVQIDSVQRWAKLLPSGNYSTTACEPEITIRLTDRARGGFEVRPTQSPFRCTVWLSQIRRPMPSLDDILAGCHAVMDAVK